MKPIWDRIHVWLAANAPVVLASLRPGATEQQIRAAERAMGVTLPDDVRAAYRIHDGNANASFLYGRYWNSLQEMVDYWRFMKGLLDDGRFARSDALVPGEETRSDYWHPAWIPLALDETSSFMALDLAPSPDGDVGQILYWWRDMDSPRHVAAHSFTAWLDDFIDELEEGEWVDSEEFGGLARVDDVESLEDDE
jgi:cell wall assembly regulator SMI1